MQSDRLSSIIDRPDSEALSNAGPILAEPRAMRFSTGLISLSILCALPGTGCVLSVGALRPSPTIELRATGQRLRVTFESGVHDSFFVTARTGPSMFSAGLDVSQWKTSI